MSGAQGKVRKLVGLNFAVVVLLLFGGGLTITSCKNVKIGPSANEKSKENQQGKSGEKLNKNQSGNSVKKKSDQKLNSEQEETKDDQDLDK